MKNYTNLYNNNDVKIYDYINTIKQVANGKYPIEEIYNGVNIFVGFANGDICIYNTEKGVRLNKCTSISKLINDYTISNNELMLNVLNNTQDLFKNQIHPLFLGLVESKHLVFSITYIDEDNPISIPYTNSKYIINNIYLMDEGELECVDKSLFDFFVQNTKLSNSFTISKTLDVVPPLFNDLFLYKFTQKFKKELKRLYGKKLPKDITIGEYKKQSFKNSISHIITNDIYNPIKLIITALESEGVWDLWIDIYLMNNTKDHLERIDYFINILTKHKIPKNIINDYFIFMCSEFRHEIIESVNKTFISYESNILNHMTSYIEFENKYYNTTIKQVIIDKLLYINTNLLNTKSIKKILFDNNYKKITHINTLVGIRVIGEQFKMIGNFKYINKIMKL